MTFLGIPLLVWWIVLGLMLVTLAIAVGPDIVSDVIEWRRGGAARRRQSSLAELGRLRARIRRAARPTLLLTPTSEPGFSKVGGLPELPAGVAWPMGEKEPRAFVAQIDLGAFRPHVEIDWLPSAGRIYAFFDDWRNGAADCVRVLYSLDPAGPSVEPPALLSKRWRFSDRRLGFMRFTSVPSLEWLGADLTAWPDSDEFDERGEFSDADFGDEIEHRIGGYPSEIQGGQMAIECEYVRRGLTRNYDEDVPEAIRRASRQWRLLLQVDSDPALGMNWWDAGRLYIFVRERDARAGDFSKTVTITQTH